MDGSQGIRVFFCYLGDDFYYALYELYKNNVTSISIKYLMSLRCPLELFHKSKLPQIQRFEKFIKNFSNNNL